MSTIIHKHIQQRTDNDNLRATMINKDTKTMLSLLKEGRTDDHTAGRKVLNPRKEVALLRARGYDVGIQHCTDKKREYYLK